MKEEELKETKIQIPAGCEVEKIETQDGHIVVTFKEKKRKLPKSWEEFCDMFPIKIGECFIDTYSEPVEYRRALKGRGAESDRSTLPDRATAEAVIALCQLIQLRNCYNGDWVPNWTDEERKYTIVFYENEIWSGDVCNTPCILYFKTRELRDEFLKYFRPLIEKLKPLYGIMEGGEE